MAIERIDQKKIIFLGSLKDVVPLLSACDVLVFAGTTPHFPRPIYEAWAMKKPVIAFDMDGITQNIDDGVDGIIVRKNNGKSLGEAVSLLLNSEDQMRKMGENGYEKAQQRFRSDRNVPKIMGIYKQILDQQKYK